MTYNEKLSDAKNPDIGSDDTVDSSGSGYCATSETENERTPPKDKFKNPYKQSHDHTSKKAVKVFNAKKKGSRVRFALIEGFPGFSDHEETTRNPRPKENHKAMFRGNARKCLLNPVSDVEIQQQKFMLKAMQESLENELAEFKHRVNTLIKEIDGPTLEVQRLERELENLKEQKQKEQGSAEVPVRHWIYKLAVWFLILFVMFVACFNYSHWLYHRNRMSDVDRDIRNLENMQYMTRIARVFLPDA